jgi:hypothetical protein
MPGYPHLNEVPLSGQQLAERVAKALEPMSPSERAEFLQQEECKARAAGDLEILRAIREYNKALRLSTPPPPKDSA